MNRMIRMMSAVLVVGGLAACHDDPTVAISGEPDRIQATPQAMFVDQGATEELFLRLTDNANFSTPTGPYTVTGVGAGLTVVWDSLYRPDYIGSDSLTSKPIKSQHRYFVTSTTAQTTSFTVAAGSISQVITVTVRPTTLGPALSATAPAIGDPVTITAPLNLNFDVDETEVSFSNADAPVVTEITPTSITFVPQPGSAGVATVTNVTTNYSTAVGAKTLTTTNEISVPSMPTVTLSTASAGVGEPVVITAGAGQAFAADVEVSFPNEDGSDNLDAVKVSQTATTITVLPIPGSNGAATVDGVVLTSGQGAVLGEYTVLSVDEVVVPPVVSIPVTFSNAAPAAGQPVTISAVGVVFHPDLEVSFGGASAPVLSVATDGSSAVILPPASVAGEVATVSNFNLASLATVTLVNVPSVATLTSTNYPAASAAGTSLATAVPLSAAVTPTQSAYVVEAGPITYGPDVNYLGGVNVGAPRYYQLTVAADGTYDVNMGWTGGGDFDLYVRDAAEADVDSSPSGANPEHVEVDLVAGTYYIVLHNWQGGAPNPATVTVTVSPVVE